MLGDVISNAPNVGRINSIGDFFGIALNVGMGAGVSVSVIFLGLAGIRFIMAGGDPKAMDQAKKAVTYSVVALVLTLGAFAIKNIILGSILDVSHPALENATPTPDFN